MGRSSLGEIWMIRAQGPEGTQKPTAALVTKWEGCQWEPGESTCG